jgi:DNA-binding SARP family transcriptional activator
VQVCGPLAIEIDGRRVESGLPGRQGRLLFVFLAANRLRSATRDELVDAVWGARPPPGAAGALRVLLSKVRRILGPDLLPAGAGNRLILPPDARVDLEAARDAIHRAESALALGQWERAWGAAQVTLFTARRGFLPGDDAAWIDELRRELDGLGERALECYGGAALEIGGTELVAAERAGRELVRRSPYHERGHALLMRALASRGNAAEALTVYESFRLRLRNELGIVPCADLRELHAVLLRSAARPAR